MDHSPGDTPLKIENQKYSTTNKKKQKESFKAKQEETQSPFTMLVKHNFDNSLCLQYNIW